MKNVIRFAGVLALLFLPFTALSQEPGTNPVAPLNDTTGKAKRSNASPSYGFTLFHGSVRAAELEGVTGTFTDDGLFSPAIDMRFFIGKSVLEHGGFYSGVESGILVFVPAPMGWGATYTDTVSISATMPWAGSYEFHVRSSGAFAFLMAKYGYRFDTGISLYGLSMGLELGTGVGIYDGSIRLYAGDSKDTDMEVDYGSDRSVMSLIVDAALEVALRLGPDFKVFGKLGLVLLPLQFPMREQDEIDKHVLTDPAPTMEEYIRYALQRYTVEMDSLGYDIRFGFALSFN